MHFPKPFFKKSRNTWYVELNRRQINLGLDKDEAFRRYHKLMTQPQEQKVSADSLPAIVDAFLDGVRKNRALDTYEWYRYRLQRLIDGMAVALRGKPPDTTRPLTGKLSRTLRVSGTMAMPTSAPLPLQVFLDAGSKTQSPSARSPAAKLLDEFEFSARPSVNKPLVLELLQGEFLDRRENILLVGPSGTGKTHLATALGLAAHAQGHKVRFFRVTERITLLLEAKEDKEDRVLLRLRQQLGKLDLLLPGAINCEPYRATSPHNCAAGGKRRVHNFMLPVVILDEPGYVPANKAGAELLFDMIATAYQRYSLIVTTNLPFENWTEMLGR